MRAKVASVAAALCVRRPPGFPIWISVFLLLILIQMLTSLLLFAGVFILSDEILISPFRFCLSRSQDELSCDEGYRSTDSGAETEIKINILTTLVIVCLYVPVVLVAFALLTVLLAAYAKDRAALWVSEACQGASSLLILIGVIAFLLLNQSYVSWKHMTLWFYICVGVQVQLVIATALTRVSGTRLMSNQEYMDINGKSSSPC